MCQSFPLSYCRVSCFFILAISSPLDYHLCLRSFGGLIELVRLSLYSVRKVSEVTVPDISSLPSLHWSVLTFNDSRVVTVFSPFTFSDPSNGDGRLEFVSEIGLFRELSSSDLYLLGSRNGK